MTTPLDNFDKMQQTLEKSLRIAEAFNNQVFAFNDALRPLASNFCATASAINSSAIIDAARSLSSSRFPSVLDAVNRSGVITATNVLTDRLVSSIASISSVLNSNNLSFLSDAVRASVSISREVLDSVSLAQKLIDQLTLPPVHSISSLAYELKNSMVDQETDEVTVQFKDFAKKISKLHPEDFAYTEINDNEVKISAAMSEIIDASFPESVNNFRSQEKSRIATTFFRLILIPLLAFVIPLGYQIYSDHQSAIASDKLLAEEQKQTEYLREISESLKSCECNKHIDSPDREQKHHYPKE